MAQQFRACAGLGEDCLTPSTHVTAHSCPTLVPGGSSIIFWPHQAASTYKIPNIHADINIHKIKICKQSFFFLKGHLTTLFLLRSDHHSVLTTAHTTWEVETVFKWRLAVLWATQPCFKPWPILKQVLFVKCFMIFLNLLLYLSNINPNICK